MLTFLEFGESVGFRCSEVLTKVLLRGGSLGGDDSFFRADLFIVSGSDSCLVKFLFWE